MSTRSVHTRRGEQQRARGGRAAPHPGRSTAARKAILGGMAALALLVVPHQAAGQAAGGEDAAVGDGVVRIAVIRAKPGMRSEFEDGYRRHLDWHRAQHDPWGWYGWEILTGERVDLFMDGTFGHDWADLDHAVAPAQDAADNERNVSPYADFVFHAVYRLRPELGAGRFLERRRPPPFIELLTVEVRPGRDADFERLVRSMHGALAFAGGGSDAAVYELVNGADARHYLIMLPRETLASLERSPRGLAALVESGHGSESTSTLGELANRCIRSVRSELLHYRADLSYQPEGNR